MYLRSIIILLFTINLSFAVVVVFRNEFSSGVVNGNDLVGLGALLGRNKETLTFYESPDLSELKTLPLLTFYSRSYVCDDTSLGEEELSAAEVVNWFKTNIKDVKLDKLVVVVISCDGEGHASKGVGILDNEVEAIPAEPGSFISDVAEGLKKSVKEVMVVGTTGYAVVDIENVAKTQLPFRVFDNSQIKKLVPSDKDEKLVEIPSEKEKTLKGEQLPVKTVSDIAAALLKSDKALYLTEMKDNEQLFFPLKNGFVAAPLKGLQFRQKRNHSRIRQRAKTHNKIHHH